MKVKIWSRLKLQQEKSSELNQIVKSKQIRNGTQYRTITTSTETDEYKDKETDS